MPFDDVLQHTFCMLLLLSLLLLVLVLVLPHACCVNAARSSELGCCHRQDGGKYYLEEKYQGEPEAPWAKQLAAAMGKASTSSAEVASYSSSDIFNPRGGSAECVWTAAYHSPVKVTESTKQVGVATATW